MLTASAPHNWAKGGGLDLVGRLEILAQFLGGKEDFRSPSLFLSLFGLRLASLCDLWSLTSCLHMGGHGCGDRGVLGGGGVMGDGLVKKEGN